MVGALPLARARGVRSEDEEGRAQKLARCIKGLSAADVREEWMEVAEEWPAKNLGAAMVVQSGSQEKRAGPSLCGAAGRSAQRAMGGKNGWRGLDRCRAPKRPRGGRKKDGGGREEEGEGCVRRSWGHGRGGRHGGRGEAAQKVRLAGATPFRVRRVAGLCGVTLFHAATAWASDFALCQLLLRTNFPLFFPVSSIL